MILTEREQQILELTAKGLRSSEIAEALGTSVDAVYECRARALRKQAGTYRSPGVDFAPTEEEQAMFRKMTTGRGDPMAPACRKTLDRALAGHFTRTYIGAGSEDDPQRAAFLDECAKRHKRTKLPPGMRERVNWYRRQMERV